MDNTSNIIHNTSAKPKLSFIVPYYNVEPYIEKCIRSLYNQNIPLEEYEVICVDDCSPDGSRAIVERLQKEYPTLKLLCHTENKRQGGARNTGLRSAKGEYIWFVDSDDYIRPNVLNQLYEEAKQYEADILHFDHYIEDIHGKLSNTPSHKDDRVYKGLEFSFDEYYQHHTNYALCWGVWFQRAFLEHTGNLFAEYVQYEDTDYAYRAYALARRVKHSEIIPYVSVGRADSTTSSPDTAQKLYYQVMLLARSLAVCSLTDDKRYHKMLKDYVHNEASIIGRQVMVLPPTERKLYRKYMRKVFIYCLLPLTSVRNWCRLKYAWEI